jgi:hypothetical protein
MGRPQPSLFLPRISGLARVAVGVVAIIAAGRFVCGWAGFAAAIIWWLAWVARDRRLANRWASPARREHGIVLVAEAARWLCIRWGFARIARGLAAGGTTGSIELFRWSTGWRGFLAIPSLLSHAHMRGRGRRLAEKIVGYQQHCPGRPVDLIGYSCGAYVVLAALESLPADATVRTVILLAPTVWPEYDLTAALQHVSNRLIYVHSRGDWLINGLGPLLLGTADRRHSIAAGTVGFRCQPDAGVAERLISVPYTYRFLRSGYAGDHFTVASSGFARDDLASWLGDRT